MCTNPAAVGVIGALTLGVFVVIDEFPELTVPSTSCPPRPDHSSMIASALLPVNVHVGWSLLPLAIFQNTYRPEWIVPFV